MIYQGKALTADLLPSRVAHLVFDLEGSSVNKFNQQTLEELQAAVAKLQNTNIKGVIFSSAKSAFIVGADITEFIAKFSESEDQIMDWLEDGNKIFNDIEDLPVPTVSLINGFALGGGFEMAICTDYRIGTSGAVVGFPEVRLGILPGFGGTVRMPRLIGADNANQWISSGSHIKSQQAFEEGLLDAIVEEEKLLEAAVTLIQQCNEGKFDYKKIRQRKTSALTLTPIEMNVAFDSAKGIVGRKAGIHYPAPVTAIQVMKNAATLDRAGALEAEHKGFVKLAKSKVAANLVQMFLNDQFLSGKSKKLIASAIEIRQAAVLGAGIMGGGIAYQSALKATPILMKDIVQEGIDLGMSEAYKLANKQVSRGKMDSARMVNLISNIQPTLTYEGFDRADIVVEAVIENTNLKKKVLSELEEQVRNDTIIATNTSTISVDELAISLKRPENFCGMHFFNPVSAMPLVEVIRGARSSETTVATAVAYARKMGKTPIVVNNCPGFLVNRILFPYFGAFSQLIHEGADFRQIDNALEAFGWPMGPAYLLDVIGIDTAVHCQEVMAAGFERMNITFDSAIDRLYERKYFGQKTGKGFYLYEPDKRGKPKKLQNPEVGSLIAGAQSASSNYSDEKIIEQMMLAMCLETVRCLEDGIVETPIEADMGLVLGLGFPTFRGGALRYIDSLGIAAFCEKADKYSELGEIYKPTEQMRAKAAAGETYYV
jgi:3-hydroxyacyl-CoA dehydrogenase/enoyl-CoA hydratase/3-hydroxybutyryl-CoA epimerase/enoyl-CoA isomerase